MAGRAKCCNSWGLTDRGGGAGGEADLDIGFIQRVSERFRPRPCQKGTSAEAIARVGVEPCPCGGRWSLIAHTTSWPDLYTGNVCQLLFVFCNRDRTNRMGSPVPLENASALRAVRILVFLKFPFA